MNDTTAVELPPPPPRDAATAIVAAAELLWPAPASIEIAKRNAPVGAGRRIIREHLLVPTASQPRLIVPAGARAAAAAIAARRSGSGGATGRIAAATAALLVRSRIADRVVRDRLRVTVPVDAVADDIESRLSELLGTRVIAGLHVGTARVNRKPVVHAVGDDGRTLAFVKVGHTESARQLVRDEAATLRELADHRFATLLVPQVLALGGWRDLELLVLSPLAGRPIRPEVRNAPYAAMRELAEVHALTHGPLDRSAFLSRLADVPRSLAGVTAERYAVALAALRAASATVAFGAWHGDWQPFNMALADRDGRIALWDWERFATGVPVGFDALHYLSQVLLLQRGGVSAAVETEFVAAADAVAVRGGATAETAAVVVAAYVAEIAGRYLTLAEGPDGQLLARRAMWTLGLFESCVARL